MRRYRRLLYVSLALGISLSLWAGEFACQFAKEKWRPGDWILVKSGRWDRVGTWVQRQDCIENAVPADAAPKDLRGKRAGETYTSMVWNRELGPDTVVRATMSFAERMAPLIVIAPELGKDARGRPEFRNHFEVVLFDQGINVWQHFRVDGKPAWKKLAYSRFPLKPNTRYRLEVSLKQTAKGRQMVVKVDGHEFGFINDVLPVKYRVGITGCEGVNRFYDFRVSW